MSEAVEAVECEWESKSELGRDLESGWPRCEDRCQARRVQVPAEERRHEVRSAEQVEAGGQDAAGDSVCHGQNPRDLGLVDGKMGANRAVLALRGQDIVGGLLAQFLRCDGSAFWSVNRHKAHSV
jgi:hypothetical protein